jgi:hypothetical protein
MSRIFTYKEIWDGRIPTPEQISTIIARAQELPEFKNGNAIVFGSAALGKHTWRSDIDIATYDPTHDLIDPLPPGWQRIDLDNVRMRLHQIVQDVIGKPKKEPWMLDSWAANAEACDPAKHIVNLVSLNDPFDGDNVDGMYHEPGAPSKAPRPRFFSPTLRDHFRMLAQYKGGRHRDFYEMVPWKRGVTRTYAIRRYCAYFYDFRVSMNIAESRFSWHESDVSPVWMNCSMWQYGRIESFPKHLMRKILAQKHSYPTPDTPDLLIERFRLLPFDWAPQLLELFTPFLEWNDRYADLVDRAKKCDVTPKQYVKEIDDYFNALPIRQIGHIVKKAFPSIINYYDWMFDEEDRESSWP